MKAFLVVSLVGLLAVGHGRLINSNANSYNSFLKAGNIFPAHLDSTLDFNARDGLTVEQQLEAVLAPTPNLETVYRNYLAEYNVDVQPESLSTRLELFKQTLMNVAAHNMQARAGVEAWTKGITRFADRTAAEKARYLSPRPEVVLPHNATTWEESEFLPLYELLLKNAPSSLDYRKDGIVTPVKDQGCGCEGGGGSCYAFAATGVTESAYARKNGQQISLAEYEIVTCGNGEPGIKGCDGGDLYFTLQWMKKNGGLAQEGDMPVYRGTVNGQMSCPGNTKSKAHFGQPNKVEYLQGKGQEDKLLALLLAHGPVGVSVAADEGWFAYKKGDGVYQGSCAPGTNHAVLAVGYTPEAWIIKNSWDASWGEDGYIYLPRGVNKCGVGNLLRAIVSLA